MATALHPDVMTPASALSSNPLIASQPQPQNYLQRCVQELNPEWASMHESHANFYAGCSKAVLVAFIILAVGIFVGVGSIAPIYLPLISVGTFVLMEPTWELYQYGNLCSLQCMERAYQLKGIAREFDTLPDNVRLLGIKIAAMHIIWNRIPGIGEVNDLNQLRPLVARYEFWKKRQESLERESNVLVDQSVQLRNSSITPEQRASNQERNEELLESIFNVQHAVFNCKIRAAFEQAAIQRPDFTGTMDDLSEICFPSPEERIFASDFNQPAINPVIIFKDRTIQSITFSEIRDNAAMPTHMLAQRFVQAIAAAVA